MNRHSFRRRLLAAWILLVIAAPMVLAAEKEQPAPPPKAQIEFVRHIKPILRTKCYSCHGADVQEGGLRLDRKKPALAGGDRGPAIVVGKGGESLLVHAVARTDEDMQMPPEGEGNPLTEDEVALLRAWIDEGAVWPDGVDDTADAHSADHWAFQPIRRPQPPQLNHPWVRNAVDAFVLRRLKESGVEPAATAERHVLIRRLYLDLIGLPPSPAELDNWTESSAHRDQQGDWYEQLVDHLLDSPHFGERWGRHWLDLARYADSDGYEKDLPRPYAWRWRDWVIDAVNRDLPFDQFTIEQLAGDLLPNATLEQKIATGFHRNTLTNREGGVDQEEYRIKAVKDRVYTTGTVWLGLTVQCSECHSHKFDPLAHREYYGLMAFFNNADETDISARRAEEVAAYRQAKADFDKRRVELEAELAAVDKELSGRQAAWEQQIAAATAGEREKLPAHIVAILDVPVEQRTGAQSGELTEFYRGVDPELARLNKALADHAKKEPKPPATKAQAFHERTDPRENYVHLRGDFRQPGEEVQPHTPSVLHPFQPRSEHPDRLDLARWLVDPANPLTPRVAVNHIWQHLFGRGLVETTWDFGTQGAKPSHPDLLDWLAAEYIHAGWSRKAMIKLIVQSATYRQSSAARPELADRDPKNDLLARQNRFRLDAEIVRDLSLASSGLLHRQIGGPSVQPPLPADVAALGYAGSVKWRESPAPDKYRRGMYIFFQRSVPYPMLTTFDAPESTIVSTQRDRSNTPLQALTLLNDPVFVDCARALALRVLQEELGGVDARVRHVFRLCLAREPDEFELDRLRQLHDRLVAMYQADVDAAAEMVGDGNRGRVDLPEAAGWVILTRTVMNLDEFLTRE